MLTTGLVFFTYGVGLLFFGKYVLTENVKQLVNIRLHKLVARYAKNKYLGLLWGGIFMLLTQSAYVTTFFLIGLIRSNLIQVSQSFSISLGYYLFAGLYLISLTVVNIKLSVLLIIGFSALVYVRMPVTKWRFMLGAVLGIGFMFLGVFGMKDAIAPLMDLTHFNIIASWFENEFLLVFLIGAALSLVVQSSFVSIVLLIPLVHINLLSINEGIMYIYGANFASGIIHLYASKNMDGKTKQITVYQAVFNLLGVFLLVPLFYVEIFWKIPLIKSVIVHLATTPDTQVAVGYLLSSIVPCLILFFFPEAISNKLNAMFPESLAEKLSKPKYLKYFTEIDSSSALELIYLEQQRVLKILNYRLGLLRSPKQKRRMRKLIEAYELLQSTIYDVIVHVSERTSFSVNDYYRLHKLIVLDYHLRNVHEILINLEKQIISITEHDFGINLSQSTIEGLDAIMILLRDVAKHTDPDDVVLLENITSEEGNGMRAVRESYLSQDEKPLTQKEKLKLLAITNDCDQLIRVFNQIGKMIVSIRNDKNVR